MIILAKIFFVFIFINIDVTSSITIKFNQSIVPGTNYSKIYVKNLTTGKIVTIIKQYQVTH